MINNFKVIVSGFVFNSSGELLVIRRSMHEESFPGMLAVPGGTVEVSANSGLVESVIEDNLVREVKEETGVDIAVTKWMESSSIAKDTAKLYLFFECKVNGNETTSISEENTESFWIDPKSLDENELTPALSAYVADIKSLK